MILNSYYKPLCNINLPYRGRQKYMHSFDLTNPIMAEGFEDYLDPVIKLCCAANAHEGIAHMTVDEKIIQAGMSQRRPKPHVDGCFMPLQQSWVQGGWTHGWLHYCNNIPFQRMSVIVVSNPQGCRVWEGKFEGEPKNDGDLSHLELEEGKILLPNKGYLLSPDCIHESMIFNINTKRTFLRIALPIGNDL
jgi:hypothetical protein